METFLGNGVLIAEGADHRRQRKILNPSFSQAAVRDQVPMFLDKAYDLKDKFMSLVNDASVEASPTPATKEDTVPGTRKIDVMRYLAQATLDVIGLAGFNYDFRSLSTTEGENELAEAYRNMFQATQSIDTFAIMQAFIKPLRWIVSPFNPCLGTSLYDALTLAAKRQNQEDSRKSTHHRKDRQSRSSHTSRSGIGLC
jgi:hypothetical protein